MRRQRWLPAGNHSRSKVSRIDGMLERHDEEDAQYAYWDGVIGTPHGFVCVYADATDAVFRFIHHGYEYYYRVNQGYSRRGLARIAGRFATHVARGAADA